MIVCMFSRVLDLHNMDFILRNLHGKVNTYIHVVQESYLRYTYIHTYIHTYT